MTSSSTKRLCVVVLFDTAGFLQELPLTGAAARTLGLNQRLVDHGADVTLLLCDLNPRSQPTADWPMPVRYLPYDALYGSSDELSMLVKELAPDVLVMSNTQLVVRCGRRLADAAGSALIYEMHDDEFALTSTVGSEDQDCYDAAVLQAAAAQSADAVVVFTSHDAAVATSIGARSVHIVPCGVTSSQAGLAHVDDTATAVFVGNLFYEPNIRAVTFLGEHVARAVTWLGGHIDVYGRYPRTRHDLAAVGLRLHGPIVDLRAAISRATVGLAPLDSGGGMKLKVLEYMAAGLPVVGTHEAFAGLPAPERFALISTAAGMSDFPKLVTTLIHDEQLRRQLGETGRHVAAQQFSWDAMAARAVAAYRSTRERSGRASIDFKASEGAVELATRQPYWLLEWLSREETTMQEPPTPSAGQEEHPILARLAKEIECARQAAESALNTTFDRQAIFGYGGRSMVFLGVDAILKIYTHRPAERSKRERAGLAVASRLPAMRVPHVLGHDDVTGSLSWVSASRLDGAAPVAGTDAGTTRLLGELGARLHSAPEHDLGDLAPFLRNFRPLPDDAHPGRVHLSTVLEGLDTEQRRRCVTGFVHGDFSARNILLTPDATPA